METCTTIQSMLAAYALEALEPEERQQVEVHLTECATCRSLLAEYQAVGEGLALAVAPVAPPARLRKRLASRIAPHHRLPLSQRWRERRPAVAWALAALLFLLQLLTLQQTLVLTRTTQHLAAQAQAYQEALALLTYPDARVVAFQGERAYGTLVYRPDDRVAVLSVEGLAQPPPGKAYQLWLIRPDGARVSGGVFTPMQEGNFTVLVVHAPEPLNRFVGAGVTLEPEEGSPGPTGPRILGSDF